MWDIFNRIRKSFKKPEEKPEEQSLEDYLREKGVPEKHVHWKPLSLPGVRGPYMQGFEDAQGDLPMEPEKHGYDATIHVSSYMMGFIAGCK